MTEISLPHFGKLNLDNLEEHYNTDVEHSGRKIQIDLNFEAKKIDAETFNKIKKIIENIETFDKQNKNYITTDFKDETANIVKDYVTFHIEELGDDFLEQLHIPAHTINKEQNFIQKLNLMRVGLYPDGKYNTSYFAVFDYTVSRDLTDQLIVVKTDENGNLDHLSWES